MLYFENKNNKLNQNLTKNHILLSRKKSRKETRKKSIALPEQHESMVKKIIQNNHQLFSLVPDLENINRDLDRDCKNRDFL